MTDADPVLFDLDANFSDGHAATPIAELRALHDRGVVILGNRVGVAPGAVFRVRDASTRAWDDADRRHQVTVRRKTASGADAVEWQRMVDGVSRSLVYGWLRGDEVEAYLVLDCAYLLEDIADRPGCLVPPNTGGGLLHHAPGGAEFYVVDVRRVSERVVIAGHGPVEWSTMPAELAYQDGLF